MPKSEVPTRVNLRDLARKLGLSDRAVSQALSPRASNVRLNPDTVRRVRELAEKWNYRPHASARAMRAGKFFSIGYFEAKKEPTSIPLRGSEDGIHDAANANGFRVILIKIPSDTSPENNPIPLVFREAHLDALIVSNLGRLSPECKDAIDASGLPVIYFNEKKPKNSVYVDDFYGAREITRHLISRGYCKISYLSTSEYALDDLRFRHYSVEDRRRGYGEAMRAADLKPDFLELQGNWFESFSRWKKKKTSRQALVCPGDLTVLRLFRVIYRDGIVVPRDLAVTGYGDDFAEDCPVPLTTMHIPFYEMGRAAANMAIRILNNGDRKLVPSEVFKPELVIRESA